MINPFKVAVAGYIAAINSLGIASDGHLGDDLPPPRRKMQGMYMRREIEKTKQRRKNNNAFILMIK